MIHNTIDVRVHDHGSTMLLVPLTTEGRGWIDEHMHLESWQWFGGGVAVEPRYFEILATSMILDGLNVMGA